MAKEKNYKVKKSEYYGWYEVSAILADGRLHTVCDTPQMKADGKLETRSQCIKRLCKKLGVEY